MELIIDIPEKIEEYIKDYIPIGAGDNVFCYPDEIVRMIQNGTPIPDNATVCDIEQIRDEIEKVFCMSVVTNELRTPMEVKTEILQIIDKIYKGGNR